MEYQNKLVICVSVLFLIIIIYSLFVLQKPNPVIDISGSNLSCPMFKCNIYRTGNLNFDPGKNNIDTDVSTAGSNAPENYADRGIIDNNNSFDPSPVFVDLDRDGIDEVVTFYKNVIYDKITKNRPFCNFVMAVKYKEHPTELEKLEFGEVPYIRHWYFVLPGEIHTSFSIGDLDNDGYPEIAFGCDDSNLYVLDNKGKLVFKFETNGKVRSTPAIADTDRDGNQEIIFGSDDGNLYVLDNKGKLKWKFKTEGKIESSPAFSDNYISIGSDDRYFYNLDSKGNLICKFKTKGKIRSSPLIYKNRIIFGSDDGNIYIINKECSLIKKYETKGKVRSSAAVFRDYFVIGSEDGNLYFFNETELKKVFLNSPVFSTPASINEGVLISTSNGKIYLVNLTSKKELRENNLTKNFSCSPSIGNKNLYSCFLVQYEDNNQYAGFFISPVNPLPPPHPQE